ARVNFLPDACLLMLYACGRTTPRGQSGTPFDEDADLSERLLDLPSWRAPPLVVMKNVDVDAVQLFEDGRPTVELVLIGKAIESVVARPVRPCLGLPFFRRQKTRFAISRH